MRVRLSGAVLAVSLVVSGRVAAESVALPPHTHSTPEAFAAAKAKLDGPDAATVEQAMTALVAIGGDASAQAIVARLRRGLPPTLTSAAIDGLIQIKSPGAAPALLELSLHRRAAIRAKAIDALGALKIKTAQSALLYALDDPSADVRASAVRSLASVGTSRALPALLTAAERGVSGAWQSVGAIATSSDLKRLLSHAVGGDITPLIPALDAMMARSTFDLDGKLRIIQELERLGTPSARGRLDAWVAQTKTNGPVRLEQALVASLKRIDAGARTSGAVGLSIAAHGGKPNQSAAVAEAPTDRTVTR